MDERMCLSVHRYYEATKAEDDPMYLFFTWMKGCICLYTGTMKRQRQRMIRCICFYMDGCICQQPQYGIWSKGKKQYEVWSNVRLLKEIYRAKGALSVGVGDRT